MTSNVPPKVIPASTQPAAQPDAQPVGLGEEVDLILDPPSAEALGEIASTLAAIQEAPAETPVEAVAATPVQEVAVEAEPRVSLADANVPSNRAKPMEGIAVPVDTQPAPVAQSPEPTPDPVPPASEMADNEMSDGDVGRVLNVRERLSGAKGARVLDENPTSIHRRYEGVERIPMSSAAMSVQEPLMSNIEVFARQAQTDDDSRWSAHVMNGTINHPAFIIGEGAMADEADTFQIGLREGDILYRSAYPKFRSANDRELTGEEALQNMMGTLGYGRIFMGCMWNSGFWVSFRPAPPSAWAAINRAIANSHYEVLQRSYGLLNSSRTSHAVDTIISLIIPYIYSTTVKGLKLVELPRYLSSHDKHHLLWSFIAARYMNGFGIQRPCISDMTKCRHVTSETLMVSEMQRVAVNRLTDGQKALIRSRQTESISLDDVERYQREMSCAIDRSVTIPTQHGTSYELVLTVPRLDTELMTNRRYLDETQEAILRGVTRESSLDTRNAALNEELTLTEMRTYAPWVKEIRVGGSITKDRPSIEKMLGTMSLDMVSSDHFFREIRKFIDESSVSVLGLKPLVCPVCGADHGRKTMPGFGDYIPVDVVSLFSNLAQLTAELARARADTEG